MKRNMGLLDRTIRLLLTIVIAILYQTKVITGTLAIVLLVIAVIFLITSLFGFCPVYALLGISTIKKRAKEAREIKEKGAATRKARRGRKARKKR